MIIDVRRDFLEAMSTTAALTGIFAVTVVIGVLSEVDSVTVVTGAHLSSSGTGAVSSSRDS